MWGRPRCETVMHLLVATEPHDSRHAKRRQLCFDLAGAGATVGGNGTGTAICLANEHKAYNADLLASFNEIVQFQLMKTRLNKSEHLCYWTTVSHKWCTPSAKLTALTVLLAGETYKRGLLPRLPMDCWYRILNMLPRYDPILCR